MNTSPRPLVSSSELANKGGAWLGATRSWIQRRFVNGDTVTWGSNQALKGAPVTPADIEELAAIVAEKIMDDPEYTGPIETLDYIESLYSSGDDKKWNEFMSLVSQYGFRRAVRVAEKIQENNARK